MQAKRRAFGRPQEDPERYSKWRDDTDPANLDVLSFYGRYLVGQYAGMGQALNLDSVRAALEIDGIDREDWPEMTSRMLFLHGVFVEVTKKD